MCRTNDDALGTQLVGQPDSHLIATNRGAHDQAEGLIAVLRWRTDHTLGGRGPAADPAPVAQGAGSHVLVESANRGNRQRNAASNARRASVSSPSMLTSLCQAKVGFDVDPMSSDCSRPR